MSSKELHADPIVIGGGLGGVAAAVTATRPGQSVVLTETSDWLGGQMTGQAVSPDEHQWIETELVSPSYRGLRQRVRAHYRNNYSLTPEAHRREQLNPGAGNVSRLCHEPRVGALAIEEMLSPLIASGQLTVLREHEPVAAERSGDELEAVTVRSRRTGSAVVLTGSLVVDATELGDLLELAAIPHEIGAESSAETGELHAPDVADPLDQQAVTWCWALKYRPGENHVIDRPVEYDHWRDTVDPCWPGSQFSWSDVVPDLLTERVRPLFAGKPSDAVLSEDPHLWHYRRILAWPDEIRAPRQTHDGIHFGKTAHVR